MNVPTLQDFIDMCKEDDVETFVLNDVQYDTFENIFDGKRPVVVKDQQGGLNAENE